MTWNNSLLDLPVKISQDAVNKSEHVPRQDKKGHNPKKQQTWKHETSTRLSFTAKTGRKV